MTKKLVFCDQEKGPFFSNFEYFAKIRLKNRTLRYVGIINSFYLTYPLSLLVLIACFNMVRGSLTFLQLHCFKGIFCKAHVHDLTGMHDLTGNLAYYDFFRKTHAPLYMMNAKLTQQRFWPCCKYVS